MNSEPYFNKNGEWFSQISSQNGIWVKLSLMVND